jgi:hypothetical protein
VEVVVGFWVESGQLTPGMQGFSMAPSFPEGRNTKVLGLGVGVGVGVGVKPNVFAPAGVD